MRCDLLESFAARLSLDDIVVIEAIGNASSAAAIVLPHVMKVVTQLEAGAHHRPFQDQDSKIDASVLAQLYVGGCLEVWTPDEPTQALRRQVTPDANGTIWRTTSGSTPGSIAERRSA
ncbi:hypothetical protein QBK99_20190 [Corticibacterium sp. UT-5YL-CI-8]|nr:hypothetical protein [Tianweitania sp. UT-5YL-CI-8]